MQSEGDIDVMNTVYLALDFASWQETKNFIHDHQLEGVPVKVGMELFYREGLRVIDYLKENGHQIFLDLKLHDIPNTVKQAAKNLAQFNADIITVHALGGSEMIKGAKEGLSSNNHTKLIAVTVLTSHDQKMVNQELNVKGEVLEYAIHLGKIAHQSGAAGVVCSVHEARQIKEACDHSFLTVTPGIRLEQTSSDDQKRIATPSKARELGSDILVVGRSVTKAKDPYQAYQQVIKEWTNGTAS